MMPIGLFGKLPGKRDFLCLNLPKGVMKLLEDWLQAALAASQHTLGAAWHNYYLIQPIWNFRIGAGVAGQDCLGAVMPSMDGVGRYFPLCILAFAEADYTRMPSMLELDDEWFDALHVRLLAALDEEQVKEPGTLIEHLPDPVALPAIRDDIEELQNGYRFYIKDWSDAGRMRKLQSVDYERGEESRSVWWTKGSQLVPSQVISVAGMPDPYVYLTMMGYPAMDQPT